MAFIDIGALQSSSKDIGAIQSSAGATPITIGIAEIITLSELLQLSVFGVAALSDTLSLSDAVTVYIPSYNFGDSLNFVDGARLTLLIPITAVDAIVLSDALDLRIGGPSIAFVVVDSLTILDQLSGLSSGVTLAVTGDQISLSELLQSSTFYQIGVSDTLSLQSAVQFAGIMIRNLNLSEQLTLTDQLRVFFTGKISKGDSIPFADFVQMVMNIGNFTLQDAISFSDRIQAGFNAAEQDAFSLTDIASFTMGIFPPELGDSLSFDECVCLEYIFAPITEYNDTLELTDDVMFHIDNSDSMLLISDSIMFNDAAFFNLSVSDTNYLRRYLNDVLGSSNQ